MKLVSLSTVLIVSRALGQSGSEGRLPRFDLRSQFEITTRFTPVQVRPEFHLAGEWRNWILDFGAGVLNNEGRRFSVRTERLFWTSTFSRVGPTVGGGLISGASYWGGSVKGTFMNCGLALTLWCDRRVSLFTQVSCDRSWTKDYPIQDGARAGREETTLSCDLTVGVSYRPLRHFVGRSPRQMKDRAGAVSQDEVVRDSMISTSPPGLAHRFGLGFGLWASASGIAPSGHGIPDPPVGSAFAHDEPYKSGAVQVLATYDGRQRGMQEVMFSQRNQSGSPELGRSTLEAVFARYAVYPWSRRWGSASRMKARFLPGVALLYTNRHYSMSQYISLGFADRQMDVRAHLAFLQVTPTLLIRSRRVGIRFASHLNLAGLVQGSTIYRVEPSSHGSPIPEQYRSAAYREPFGIDRLLDHGLFFNDLEVGVVVGL